MLVPVDLNDDCHEIIFEVRPGIGGTEAAFFAEEIFDMY